jgi:Zn-finger nucleic acid-binding protein
MILACPTCDSRYDVTGHRPGQQFRCRCATMLTLDAPSPQAGQLACPQCGAGVSPTAPACAYCNAELLLKACPRCLSRVFHGHKHCPECGTQLDVAAAGEVDAERPCPRCVTALRPRLVGDIVIDECGHCLGVFLDQTAIQRVITDRQQARAESLLGALPRAEPVALPTDGKLYIKCPCCHTIMNRRQFAAGAGIIVDVCKQHGTFFDVGELPRIIEFVMNGGLEKAARVEIERLRDQAKREQQSAVSAQMQAAHSSHEWDRRPSAAGSALVDLLFALWR